MDQETMWLAKGTELGSMFDHISVSRSGKNMESILCVHPQGPVTTVCFIFKDCKTGVPTKTCTYCIQSSMIHGIKKAETTIVRRQVKDKQMVPSIQLGIHL